MDDNDRKVFISAATMGIACGLEHRYEWYVNAQRALGHGYYAEIGDRLEALNKAFIEFEKLTASCPEEKEELDKLDLATYSKMISKWYAEARKNAVQRQLDLGR